MALSQIICISLQGPGDMKQQDPVTGPGTADGHAAVVFQKNPGLKHGIASVQNPDVILDSAVLTAGGGQHQGPAVRQIDTPLLLKRQRQSFVLKQGVPRVPEHFFQLRHDPPQCRINGPGLGGCLNHLDMGYDLMLRKGVLDGAPNPDHPGGNGRKPDQPDETEHIPPFHGQVSEYQIMV